MATGCSRSAVRDGSRIRAGVPFAEVRSRLTGNRWVSLPFSDHCQPLIDRDAPDASDVLLDYLKARQESEAPTIQLRWPVASSRVPFRQGGFVLHTLRLPEDEAALLRSLDRRVRQNVKHAERDGVAVTECASWKEFEAFYRLQVMTRKRIGVPVQPVSFFRAVWEHLIEPGLGFVLVAYKDRIPLAGGVFLTSGSTVHYKYSAADVRYKGLEGPSAVIWSGLQRALAIGRRRVDLGRTATSDAGICEFKRRWGATETDLPYSILAGRAPDAAAFEVDGLIRAVIRNAPTFVCRWTGEVFYRHFA